jgi:Tfp pilus assembly protein PilO
MPLLKKIIGKLKEIFQNIFSNLYRVYLEKGMEPFKKPVLFAAVIIFFLYFAVYSPSTSKIKNKKSELMTLESIAKYYEEYKNNKTRINYHHGKMPSIKDKDEWLKYLITTTSNKHGVFFDSLSIQSETEVGEYVVASREISATATYEKMGKWIAEIENSLVFIKITDLNFKKDTGTIGNIKLSFKVVTIFPKAFSQGASGN